jgi:hypothetical protein
VYDNINLFYFWRIGDNIATRNTRSSDSEMLKMLQKGFAGEAKRVEWLQKHRSIHTPKTLAELGGRLAARYNKNSNHNLHCIIRGILNLHFIRGITYIYPLCEYHAPQSPKH